LQRKSLQANPFFLYTSSHHWGVVARIEAGLKSTNSGVTRGLSGSEKSGETFDHACIGFSGCGA
jgi:hypothetical protein